MLLSDALTTKIKETYKKLKALGICVSVLMIIMGLVMFFTPVSATVIAMWMMVFGLLIKGVMDIVIYCKLPGEVRQGWQLASGIIWSLIALLLLIGGLSATAAEKMVIWGNFELFIAIMVGFLMVFNGVRSICSYSEVKAMGGSGGLCIFSGILGLIAGIIVFTYPIGSMITLTVFYGIFFVVSGITLLIDVLSY